MATIHGVPAKPEPSARRQRTRERIVDAAIDVVAAHGFHAATVDRIAERAGFSVGALYSNFGGKDDVLFAVFDRHLSWAEDVIARAMRLDDSQDVVAAWITELGTRPEQFLIFVEFWAYAVRKPAVRREFAGRLAQLRATAAASLEQRAAERGTTPPLPPDLLAFLGLAIGRGMAMEKLADADAVPEKQLIELLAGLLG